MMKTRISLLFAGMVLLPSLQAASKLVEKQVTGRGLSRQEAVFDGLVQAVQVGGGAALRMPGVCLLPAPRGVHALHGRA